MADTECERYEDSETNDFEQEIGKSGAENHHNECEQPNSGGDTEGEVHQQSEDANTVADSDNRLESDAPSPVLHPPGETPESSDQNTVSEECVDKNSLTKDGDDERVSQPGMSNLDRYDQWGQLNAATDDQNLVICCS